MTGETATLDLLEVPRARHPLAEAAGMFVRNHAAVAGLVMLVVIVIGSLVGPFLYTVDPYEMVWAPFSEPGEQGFLFGTDYLGRDLFAGVVNGGRVTLAVGLSAALLSVFIGVSIGALSGYYRGWVEEVLMRITEFFQVLPTLLFSMVLVALFGASLAMVTFSIGIVSWTAVARVTRSEFLRLREMEYVTASRSAGAQGSGPHPHRHPAQRPASHRGAVVPDGRQRHPVRGGAVLPGPERPQRGELGPDHRLQPALHPRRRLDGGDPRVLHLHHRARHQPGRRRPQRRAEPEAPPAMTRLPTGPLLRVRDLVVEFATRDGTVPVLDRLSFELDAGATLGLVGESGCGKSMTALAVMGLIPSPPGRIAAGSVHFEGDDLTRYSDAALRDVRGNAISMIFQEPMTSLNPVYTIGEQIAEVLRRHQAMGRRSAWERAVELLDSVSIPLPGRRVHDYPHQLSGGMRQRVMIAIALACRPRILIADEPTTALDVTVQAQIFDLLQALREETGTAIILITHDMGVVAEMAERVAVMYAGRIVEEGPVGEILSEPHHPYTQGLIASVPHLSAEVSDEPEDLAEIPGIVPPLAEFGKERCLFAPRCPRASERCREERPVLSVIGAHCQVACWHAGDAVTEIRGSEG